jgi:hypothetical protein
MPQKQHAHHTSSSKHCLRIRRLRHICILYFVTCSRNHAVCSCRCPEGLFECFPRGTLNTSPQSMGVLGQWFRAVYLFCRYWSGSECSRYTPYICSVCVFRGLCSFMLGGRDLPSFNCSSLCVFVGVGVVALRCGGLASACRWATPPVCVCVFLVYLYPMYV